MTKDFWTLREVTEPVTTVPRLTPEEKSEIKKLLSDGVPVKDIAKKTGRSCYVIYKIRRDSSKVEAENPTLALINTIVEDINFLNQISTEHGTDSIMEIVDALKHRIADLYL